MPEVNQPPHGAGVRRPRPRVYLAGPDVFLPDPVQAGETKKALCARYGLEGVFPFDAEVQAEGSRRETGLRISAANEALIRGCDAVVANMTPFRGPSADVGTAYEMGFARALGLPVFAYTNVALPFAARTRLALGESVAQDEAGVLRDADGMALEDWDLADNLMLEGGIYAGGGSLVIEDAPPDQVPIHLGGFEKCLQLVRVFFAQPMQ